MAEEIVINPDVKLAFETIKRKKALYDELYKYYTGHHPLRYSNSKLKKVFERLDAFFAENWLAVVIDAVLDRLVLKGFDISNNPEAKARLDELWRDYDLLLVAEDVHESATVVTEGFVIAMKVDDVQVDEETETEVSLGEALDIYYNDARQCHVFYHGDQPNKKRMAAKVWQDEENFYRLALYYPDRFEYYKSNAPIKAGSVISTWKQLIQDPDLPEENNPFGKIPVFHWVASRTTKKRDLGPSEISMQDAINKLVADMMVSSEFNTFVQRVIISKNDPGNLPNESGVNWWIPQTSEGPPASVIELGGRLLSPFLEAIDKLATALAIITRTPKHYFFAQGGDPSGEALIALEAPLNKKVRKRQNRYAVEWQSLAQFLLELEGITLKKSQIVPLWEAAETVQPKTSAEILKLNKEAGVPLNTAMRWQGKTDADIKQLEEDQTKEQEKMTGLAQDALNRIRAEDAKNNGRGNVQV